jgi:hypothetical protein
MAATLLFGGQNPALTQRDGFPVNHDVRFRSGGGIVPVSNRQHCD